LEPWFGGRVVLEKCKDAVLPFPRIEPKLKTKVVPEYPAVVRQLSLRGKVKIDITVSVDGHGTEPK
jgi:outer membrane biosynthesis protein TonB